MKKTGHEYRYNVLYCIYTFTKLAVHAAGIFRARDGYKFKKDAIGNINITITKNHQITYVYHS